jgi:hypothetical protein
MPCLVTGLDSTAGRYDELGKSRWGGPTCTKGIKGEKGIGRLSICREVIVRAVYMHPWRYNFCYMGGSYASLPIEPDSTSSLTSAKPGSHGRQPFHHTKDLPFTLLTFGQPYRRSYSPIEGFTSMTLGYLLTST